MCAKGEVLFHVCISLHQGKGRLFKSTRLCFVIRYCQFSLCFSVEGCGLPVPFANIVFMLSWIEFALEKGWWQIIFLICEVERNFELIILAHFPLLKNKWINRSFLFPSEWRIFQNYSKNIKADCVLCLLSQVQERIQCMVLSPAAQIDPVASKAGTV